MFALESRLRAEGAMYVAERPWLPFASWTAIERIRRRRQPHLGAVGHRSHDVDR